jgi:hypothetical protein
MDKDKFRVRLFNFLAAMPVVSKFINILKRYFFIQENDICEFVLEMIFKINSAADFACQQCFEVWHC